MQLLFVRSWKTIAMRGLIGLAFGVTAIFAPTKALFVLLAVLAGYCIFDGTLALAMAWTIGPQRKLLAFEGIVSTVFGLAILLRPEWAATIILYGMAAWAIVTGIAEFFLAWGIRRLFPQIAIWLPLAALASILLGITVMVWPLPSAQTLMVVFGCYAAMTGTATLVFALRLRAHKQRLLHGPRRLHVAF